MSRKRLHHLSTRLPRLWRAAPRRWGHPWHAMCSYMAMFPPTIPRVFIDWLTSPGDVVYDPFSGRGTTVLEARESARVGLGSDANPLAWVLSSSKASPPSPIAVRRRMARLGEKLEYGDPSGERPEIRAVFHASVLAQLLWLRAELSVESQVDRYLYAVLLGILHVNARKDGSTRGLSISMPNTFAMSPQYIVRYKRAHNLQAPRVDVLASLASRLDSLGFPSDDRPAGYAWRQDATKPIRLPEDVPNPKLIFASPPYLGVMKYAKMNWLRHWLLGQAPSSIDTNLFSSSSLPKYLEFMTQVITQLAAVLSDDGRICLVVGDVHDRQSEITTNLAEAVADHCVAPAGLRVDAVVKDSLPVRNKVSRIWRDRRGRATKVDRILILSKPGARQLPPIPQIEWSRSAASKRRRAVG